MDDEEIARKHLLLIPGLEWEQHSHKNGVLAALAAARADEREKTIAECVRRLREKLPDDGHVPYEVADWLEAEMGKKC